MSAAEKEPLITVVNVGRGQLTHEKRNHNRVQRATLVPAGFRCRFVVARDTPITVELPDGSEVVRPRLPGLVGFFAAELRVLAGLRNEPGPVVVVTGRTAEAIPAWVLRGVGRYCWVSDLWDAPHKELVTRPAANATDRARRLMLRGKNAVLRRILRVSDLVIVVAALVPDTLAPYRIPESRIVAFGNGIRLEDFDDVQGEREPGSICFVTSRFLAVRGLETLVAAVEKLEEDGVDVHVRLAGELNAQAAALIARSPVARRFDVLGPIPIEDAHGLMLRSEIGVVPFSANSDLAASFPIKLLEYMAAGAAVVASDLPGIREVVTHESEALLVPPDDPDALAAAVAALLRDAPLRDRLRANARSRVRRFDARTKNDEIFAAIRDVALRRQADPSPLVGAPQTGRS